MKIDNPLHEQFELAYRNRAESGPYEASVCQRQRAVPIYTQFHPKCDLEAEHDYKPDPDDA